MRDCYEKKCLKLENGSFRLLCLGKERCKDGALYDQG